MNNMSRVAIFGGSFDPIHNGHLALAGEVLSRGLAGEVWFMVTPQNPHKQGCTLSDEQMRLQMVQLAVDGNDVMSLTGKKGKSLGETLCYLLDRVIDGELPNDRDALCKVLVGLRDGK